MPSNQYAVVKDRDINARKEFTKIHFSFEEAKAEAERLCKLERCPFLVIQIIGTVLIPELPMSYRSMKAEDYEGIVPEG